MSLFSPRQREWLEAMGLPVYVELASLQTASSPAQANVAPAGGGPASRLQAALLRAAAGRDDVLAALGADADALRGNPAGKRALWPRLRASRRARQ